MIGTLEEYAQRCGISYAAAADRRRKGYLAIVGKDGRNLLVDFRASDAICAKRGCDTLRPGRRLAAHNPAIPTLDELLEPISKRDETIARRLVNAPGMRERWVIWHNIPHAWRASVLAHARGMAREVHEAAKRVVLLAEIEVIAR